MKTGKTILILIGMLVLASSTNAQKYGVRAGLNIATIKGDDTGDVSPRIAYYAGFFKEVTLVPKLVYLQPEIQYSSQGFQSNSSGEDKEYTIDYIQVPLLVKVYIVRVLTLEVGPQFGFKINDDYESTSADKIETFDVGATAGLGYNLAFGLSFEARYTQGFQNIRSDTDAKNQVIQLGAAFKF